MTGDQQTGPRACASRKTAGAGRNHRKSDDADGPEVYPATASYVMDGRKVLVGGRAGTGIPSGVEKQANRMDMG
jgi:hypothetical protein